MRKLELLLLTAVILFAGCAATSDLLGTAKLQTPPEFNQKVILEVSDEYRMHQAPLSGYDVGDLQSFHSQHTLPVVIEDAFKELFGQVEIAEKGPKIETERPDVPALFEVRLLDIANDIYVDSAETYRGEATLAVAMKSPRGNIFWQKSFLGKGFVRVDPQFSTGLGPQDALVDAVRDAVSQMQEAIINSPEVRAQMKYYQAIDQARQEQEQKV